MFYIWFFYFFKIFQIAEQVWLDSNLYLYLKAVIVVTLQIIAAYLLLLPNNLLVALGNGADITPNPT